MNYVKHFTINGVNIRQVACIELSGPPNAATEGAVGVLGMDMTSPTHEVYRCVAVNGSVYTWELLSAGMSIISSTITGEGGMTKSFPYNTLTIPQMYIVKPGDLILDSKGYLYQVSSIASDSCEASYCGTHFGGGGGSSSITEYDYEITSPDRFTTENLASMSGKILIKCDIYTDGDSVSVTIPSSITAINFNDHETNYTIVGHSNCRLIGAKMGVNSSYDNTVSNFGSIEFCKWSGQYVNCNRIAHSELWHATNCQFITDCTPAYFETHDANFSGCSNITNVRITDLDEDYGVEFINCDHISNVSVDTGGDGKILYTNCTYVDALTCAGYGVGVPCVDANGIVSFLDSAEGGSYGS